MSRFLRNLQRNRRDIRIILGNAFGSWCRRKNPIKIRSLRFSSIKEIDSARWFYRVEQFFAYHQTHPNQWIHIASIHLEGKALQWFRWMDRSGAIEGWSDFPQSLNVRFCPSGYNEPIGLLARLWKTTTVQQYQDQFENLANGIEGLNEAFMVSCLSLGLNKKSD